MTLPLIIHIAQEADWTAVMQKIETLWPKHKWGLQFRELPTKINHWPEYEHETCVCVEKNRRLSYSPKHWYQSDMPSIPILPTKEFLGEEPQKANVLQRILDDKKHEPPLSGARKMLNEIGIYETRFSANGITVFVDELMESYAQSTAPDIVQELEIIKNRILAGECSGSAYDKLTRLIERLKG